VDKLVSAFGQVSRAVPDMHLVIAGPDAGMRSLLEAQVHDLGLTERTHFTGLVTGRRKQALLKQARVLVLPSHHENFGAVVVEAAAAGTPVVVSHGVALWQDVLTAGAGEVAQDSPQDLAEKLVLVLGRRREAYAPGCQRLADAFAWDRTAARLAAAYRRVLRDRR